MYPVWSRGGRFYKQQVEPLKYTLPPLPHGNLARAPIPTRPAYQESVSLNTNANRGRGTTSRGRSLNSNEGHLSHPTGKPKVATPWEGALVEYMEGNTAKLAILCEPLDAHGRSWSAKTKQQDVVVGLTSITFHWPKHYLGQSYRYGMEDLVRLGDLCTTLISAHKDHIKIAWGNYVDRGISRITPEMLSNFLFGNFPKPHELYISHCLLRSEEIYFIQDGTDETLKTSPLAPTPVFRCRSLQEVSRIERERKAKRIHTQNLDVFLDTVTSVLAGKRLDRLEEKLKSPSCKPFVDKLIAAALATDSRHIDGDLFREVLQPLDLQRPKEIFNLLVLLGVFKKYQNPNLLRFPRSLELTPEQEELCQKTLPIDQDSTFRRDLRSIQPTFAIDDSDSLEIDDSISLYNREDGSTWICIHIADPSRMITPNDLLDLMARERVSSVFLPEKRFGMFHSSLSQSHFSLLPLRENYALSFLAKLTPEGDILEYEIVPSIIDNVQSLTYSEADKKLVDVDEDKTDFDRSNSQALRTLQKIAMARRSWREQNDATFVEFPNPEISIKGDGDYINVLRTDAWKSPSRLMVAEYMILVGDICARFAIKHHIPLPFRCQQSQLIGASLSLPRTIVEMRKNMRRFGR
eukprot:TRINITY_DN3063_c0_g1_i1.p1 TRINITY_DN3063_c0_g1~~TRINITY_DN3063_c0_g1_i1.p1  ORF type:complete len:634 (-),score=64.41 TRINITY_DN3063_c0_g1_i1:668-2569(-)